MHFVIKAEIADPRAKVFAFAARKTMYGGKTIAVGDEIFLFASETSGGTGLIARGVVTKVEAVPPPLLRARSDSVTRGTIRRSEAQADGGGGKPPRFTPRVSIEIRRTALAKRRLGRAELRPFRGVDDGSAPAELDFKFYRQATDKIGGISEKAARWLGRFF